jgi:hydroxypyruvate reductase/glycerate 2-kinase
MAASMSLMRDHARAIWEAALKAVIPQELVREALSDASLVKDVRSAPRIIVVGAGKAGAAMSEGVEAALGADITRVEGIVSVPASCVRPLKRIKLVPGRPAGVNEATPDAVRVTEKILQLLGQAGPNDAALCLISGGGSALLEAPARGIDLAEIQAVTRLLDACGATIAEMNAIRKHLSRVKGGQLAEGFRGKFLHTLIISDVIGDPPEVIASGPTVPDPSTYADALAVLKKYRLEDRVPVPVRQHLENGAAGQVPETPKRLAGGRESRIIGNNALALAAAAAAAERLGYGVLNLGSFIEGESRDVAIALSGVARSIKSKGTPLAAPAGLLAGGETTVTLCPDHGLGGRNQEFVLAAFLHLAQRLTFKDILVASIGTDGEDGPTDAAGAVADESTWHKAAGLGLDGWACLNRNDAYQFFETTGDLVKTGMTETNVMDVRLFLVR